jgi:CheY-like chemotaxis protein
MEMSVVRRVSIPLGVLERPFQGQMTVLLVTADPDLRAATGRALEREGYRVLAAAHSGHALLACRTASHVDVLITDLALDEMSGPALAERVRRDFPEVQTLFFGGPGTPESEGVLVHPFTRDELLAALELVSAFPV